MTLQLKLGHFYLTQDGRMARIQRDSDFGVGQFIFHGTIESRTGSDYYGDWYPDGKDINGRTTDNLVVEEASLIPPQSQSDPFLEWANSITSERNASKPETCSHEWVETPGFSRIYKDCKHCGKKWEEQ